MKREFLMNENNTNYAETIQVSSVIGNFSKAQVFLPISADAEPDSGLGFGWFTHTTNKHNK